MNVYLARQPIFNLNQEIAAYELLYRSGSSNAFSGEVGDDAASSKVIFDTFQNFGLKTITSGLPAFINFSGRLIEEEVATLFSNEYLVVEILETVEPTPIIIEKCRELKELGYAIALDDFVYSSVYEPLIDVAKVVKVDFLLSTAAEIEQLRNLLLPRGITLLAEKIETWADFHLAKELGFTLFQGYFFEKPEIITTNSLTPLELNYFRLVEEVNKEELDFDKVGEIISMDLSLTYNILKLVNSASFGLRQRLTTPHQALVMIGEREIRKWVSLLAMQEMSVNKGEGAVAQSLIRGRFSQLLAQSTSLAPKQNDLYLAGLFSLLDVMLQRPMEMILDEIQISEDVKDGLLYCTGPYHDICRTVLAYEKGDWDEMAKSAERLNLAGTNVAKSYVEAIRWHPLTAASRLRTHNPSSVEF